MTLNLMTERWGDGEPPPPLRFVVHELRLKMGMEKLLDLYPDLDGRAFAALMGQALAAADAAGRYDIETE